MRRLALILAFLFAGVASASATCTPPAVMHDFPGTSFNMSLATVPDGNCGSNVAVPLWAGGTLGAMANYGTSPGAVLVPGVNAFITNTPTVTANAGTNLNTSALALETGGNLAQVVTDFGPPGATACATDTSSCNLNQQMQRLAQRLTSIVTALGSPFQAGGSVTANQGTPNTAANAWPAKLTDGTNTAAVKAASTAPAATDPAVVTTTSPNTGVNFTPTDCSGTITTGGTAQNAFTAQTTLHGFLIKNIDASAGSGEPVWFSITGTAAANTAGSYPLAAPATTTFANGESFTTPTGFGTNHALSVIGATTGHKFSCTWW